MFNNAICPMFEAYFVRGGKQSAWEEWASGAASFLVRLLGSKLTKKKMKI